MSMSTAVTRTRIRVAIGGALMLSAIRPAHAQRPLDSTNPFHFEIRPYAGAYITTGNQQDILKDAFSTGVQMSWLPLEHFAVTGNFGWAPSDDKVTPGNHAVDVYQYDVGAEWRAPAWYSSRMYSFLPFIGAGAGGRTYNYRSLDVDSKTNFDGYGSLGGELGFGKWGIRFEGRDYIARFKNLAGADDGTKTRNDLTIATGVTLKF